PYCTPGEVFTNVLLPDVRLPVAVVETTPLDVHFAPLGLNFTAEPAPAPGALCAAQSNVGTLTLSVALRSGGGEWTVGYSTGQATLTVFGGATPHIRWETANLHFSPVPPAPDLNLYDTGPLTMD